MNRISRIDYGHTSPGNLPLSYSAGEVKNSTLNLARKTQLLTAKPEHLLVALYARQPRMIGDFLGEIELSDLSNRLLGIEIDKSEVEQLFYRPLVNKSPVFLSPEVDLVFKTAEKIARLVGHPQVGSAELFVSLIMFCNGKTKVKELISEQGIDKKKVQTMFLECNVSKHQEPAPIETSYSPGPSFSLN